MRRFVRAAAAVVVLVLLVGCGSAVDGSGTVAPDRAPSLVVPSGTAASGASPSAPSAPASSPSGSDQRDFTTVSFSVPTGFEPGTGYGAAVPLEDVSPVRDFIVPTGGQGGLDLVSVIVYTLPEPGAAATPAQQIARIQSYNTKLRATISGGIRPTTLAGIAGYTENVLQPGGTTNPRGYKYSTYFAFGRTNLVQVSCQIDTTKFAARIASACAVVRSTLTTV